MGSVVVKVADVLVHEALQMSFIQNDHMIEQISTAVSDPALSNTVLPRTSVAGPLRLDAKAIHRFDHFEVELRPSIKDKVTWCRVEGERLAQLLNDPGAGRVSGYIEVKNAPPVMRNDEEAIKHTERERRHGEEVHRGRNFAVIAEKGSPSSCRLRAPRCSPHPPQNSTLREIKAEHFQFTMNARCAPSGVLGNHPKDEFAQLFADALPSHAGSMP